MKKNDRHFLNVLKNESESDLLIWKHPVEDFNVNSVLIVNPGEQALFVRNGEIAACFDNGRHELSTQNYPVLSKIRNLLSGGESSFTATICFIRYAVTHEILWGTDSPIQLRDPIQKVATNVRARGSYQVVIEDPALFISQLVGTSTASLYQDAIAAYFERQMLKIIKSNLSQVIKNSKEEILGICTELESLSTKLLPILSPLFAAYGLKLVSFSIIGMDIPMDDHSRQILEKAYSLEREMQIMGSNYRTIKGMEIMQDAAQNSGGSASVGAGIGIGLASVGPAAQLASEAMSQQNPNCDEPVEKLQQAKQMLDLNLITKEEYENIRSQILKILTT